MALRIAIKYLCLEYDMRVKDEGQCVRRDQLNMAWDS